MKGSDQVMQISPPLLILGNSSLGILDVLVVVLLEGGIVVLVLSGIFWLPHCECVRAMVSGLPPTVSISGQ